MQNKIQLYQHQLDLIQRNPSRYGLWFDTGTGKTITGIFLANQNCSSVLVVVPKTNKQDWIDNMNKHCTVDQWRVMTKEEFKKEAPKLRPYDGVIVDEAHYFLGITSQLSKTLMAYFKKHKTEYRWLMTATPYMSTPLNVYVAARLLGHEWNYPYFVNQFFHKIPMGGRIITKPKTGKAVEEELRKLLKAIGDTVEIGEIVTVPEQSFDTVYLPLEDVQEQAIDELDEPVFITRWTKKHQIENGFVYSEQGSEHTKNFPNAKAEWIMHYVEDKDKVAIFCRYKEQIQQYKTLLQYIYPDRNIYELHGDIKDRYSVIHNADADNRCIILIQTECSAGYELPSFSHIIFASLSFSYVSYKQGLGRFLRINRLKENTYTHLVVEGGVDEDVYNCIMQKKDFSVSLYYK